MPGSAHRYWRVNVTDAGGEASTAISQLVFADAVQRPQQADGGTPLASSAYNSNFVAVRAFDGSYSGAAVGSAYPWRSLPAGMPQWLGYFGAPVVVGAVRITASLDYGRYAPRAFDVQYSDDGAAWFTAFSVSGEAAWVQGETREWANPAVTQPAATPVDPAGAWAFWRVRITAVQDDTRPALDAVEFLDEDGVNFALEGDGGTSLFRYQYNNGDADRAFSGVVNLTDRWIGGYVGDWIGRALPAARRLHTLRLRTWEAYRAPSAFAVEYSANGSAWNEAWSVSDEPAWGTHEWREYGNPHAQVGGGGGIFFIA